MLISLKSCFNNGGSSNNDSDGGTTAMLGENMNVERGGMMFSSSSSSISLFLWLELNFKDSSDELSESWIFLLFKIFETEELFYL